MPFTGKTLTKGQVQFLKKLIKAGNSKTKCIELLRKKYDRGISDRNLSKFARMHNLKFNKAISWAYTKAEETALKGLWLVKAGYKRKMEELKKSEKSISSKMLSMSRNGIVGENLRKEILRDLSKKTKDTVLARKHGISVKYIREFKDKEKNSIIEVENLKHWEDVDVDQVLDLVEQAQEKLSNISSEQQAADIKITTDSKYVALTFLSDIHLENVNTDIKQLRADIKTIKATKDFYVGFGGDLIDNFVVGPHKEGIIEAVIPPKAARLAAGKLLDTLKGRMLWSILGCHDAWDVNYADYNLPEHIARKQKIPYLGHGGDINLTLNKRKSKKKVKYEIHARHKYRGSSGIANGTACCKNILRDISSNFDIVAISHNHFSEIKMEYYLRKTRCFVRTGSYKKEDRFSKSLGFERNDFDSLIPVVILNTETKEMRVVSGIKTAADTLRALNKLK